jgi:hypothetical protein
MSIVKSDYFIWNQIDDLAASATWNLRFALLWNAKWAKWVADLAFLLASVARYC